MSSLVVGGVVIPVAVSSPNWSRSDAADRSRVFDNTFFVSQTGGAARDWTFSTPPVTQALADTYIAALASPAAKLCSGDILQIPTMCSPELPSGKPTRAVGGNYVVLDFMLHEIQPAKILLRYAPGDTITGESFSRSTTAYQLNGNINPPLTLVSINAKRDTHYINSVRSILLEDARTNSLLWSNDFSNAAWLKSTCTVGTGIADPAGGTTACTLAATAVNGYVQQNLGAGSSLVRTNSVWLRRRTGTGVVNLYDPLGANPLVCALTTNWQRFSRTGGASTIRDLVVLLATSGDEVDAWCGQQEDGAFVSSEIPTTTVAVTRGADSYSLPFTTPPQEMTVYAKFVEAGSIAAAPARLFEISNAADANPRLLAYNPSGLYRLFHDPSSPVFSEIGTPPLLGDSVEFVGRLFGDGSIDAMQSIGAAAPILGSQTVPRTLATAWAGQFLWLNSATATVATGFTALQSFKIVAGARSLAEMRTA